MSQLTVLHGAIGSVATHLPTLADVVVRATLILLLALVATSLMRHASAAARHTVWVCAVLVALLIPVLGRVAPRWDTRILPASWGAMSPSTTGGSQVGEPAVAAALGDANAAVRRADSVARTAEPSARVTPLAPVAPLPTAAAAQVTTAAPGALTRGWSLADWIAFVWIAGAVLVLLRLALGTGIVWNTARHARRVDDAEWLLLVQRKARELGIARPVILLASPRQMVPVTWGVIYPIVLLPESALAWEPARREAVLVHELAHVARLDALTHTIVQLAMALLWFDPFVWIAARRVRSERERACDDLVISHGTRASVYADDLLTMVRSLTRNTEPAFAALAMARRSEFEGRMLAILDPRADRRRVGARGVAVAAVCSLAIALPLAALRPLPRSARAAAAIEDTSRSDSATAATQARKVHDHSTGTMHTGIVSGGPSTLTCSLRNGRHVSINGTDGETNFIFSDDTHCISMVSSGKVTWGDDDASIRSISGGGHVTITEVTQNATRSYEASQTSGGVAEKYFVSGNEVPPSDANRAWLRGVILQIVRQDADLAPERVARIRKRSGVAGVLSEVNSLQGDYAKHAYLDALLSEGGFTADTLHTIGAFGARQLTSDYYKSEFLGHLGRLSHDPSTAATIASAAGTMESGYYKRQALTAALAGGEASHDVVQAVVAGTANVTSGYDRYMILLDVLRQGQLDQRTLIEAIASVPGIDGDYYKAMVLDSIAAHQSINARAVYMPLLAAAAQVTSSYYRAQIFQTIVTRRDVSTDAIAATLRSAANLSSDSDKASVLQAASAMPAIHDAAVRDAYLATTKSITSGTYYRQAASAILP